MSQTFERKITVNGETRSLWLPDLTESDDIMEYVSTQRASNLVTELQEASMWYHWLPKSHELGPVMARWMRLARAEVIHRMTN